MRVGVLFIVLLTFGLSCSDSKHPSNEAMVDHFKVNKVYFEELVEMVAYDVEFHEISYVRFNLNGNDGGERFSSLGTERVKKYKSLMKQIDVEELRAYGRDEQRTDISMVFEYSVISFYTDGTSKGYHYKEAGHDDEKEEFIEGWKIYFND